MLSDEGVGGHRAVRVHLKQKDGMTKYSETLHINPFPAKFLKRLKSQNILKIVKFRICLNNEHF